MCVCVCGWVGGWDGLIRAILPSVVQFEKITRARFSLPKASRSLAGLTNMEGSAVRARV